MDVIVPAATRAFCRQGCAAGWPRLKRANRLHAALACLTGPEGPAVAERAMKRARAVADVAGILAGCRY